MKKDLMSLFAIQLICLGGIILLGYPAYALVQYYPVNLAILIMFVAILNVITVVIVVKLFRTRR